MGRAFCPTACQTAKLAKAFRGGSGASSAHKGSQSPFGRSRVEVSLPLLPRPVCRGFSDLRLCIPGASGEARGHENLNWAQEYRQSHRILGAACIRVAETRSGRFPYGPHHSLEDSTSRNGRYKKSCYTGGLALDVGGAGDEKARVGLPQAGAIQPWRTPAFFVGLLPPPLAVPESQCHTSKGCTQPEFDGPWRSLPADGC